MDFVVMGWRRVAVCAALGVATAVSARPTHAEETKLLVQFEDRAEMMPGDSVLRMDLDVTGDGRKELLLAKAGPHEQGWLIYSWIEDGLRVKCLGSAHFSFLLFRICSIPNRILAAVRGPGGVAALVEYEVEETVKTVQLSPGAEEQALGFSEWRDRVKLSVVSTSFWDLVYERAPEWKAVVGEPGTVVDGLRDIRVVE